MARPRKSYYWWIAGKILYMLLGLGIFLMVAFLLWRVYFSGRLPKEMKVLAANDTLVAAYEENGGSLSMYTQEQGTHTRGENNYGYFAVPRFVIIPEANQVQVVFRYNNNTLEEMQKKYELGETPPRGEEVFDVTLLQMIDLTPEDDSDNEDGSEALLKKRIAPTDYIVETTSLYTYFLYTFDGVDIDEDTLVVYFDIYFGENPDYEGEADGTLRLYHYESENIEVALTNKDKKALEGR